MAGESCVGVSGESEIEAVPTGESGLDIVTG